MRTTTALASILLATAPALTSARGTLGFCLGTKEPNGDCKTQQDYEKDFDAIKSETGSTIVRGYAASDCNFADNILPAAKSKGFKVVLGIWPDVEESYQKDKKAIVDNYSKFKDQIYGVTVGSETLYRGNFTGDTLLNKINDVKSSLPGAKVGTADSWNKLTDGTGDALIKGGVTFFLVNAFAFWQGSNVGAGAEHTYFDDLQQAFGHIQQLAGGVDKVEIWNGETGWPTDGGTNYKEAVAGTAQASKFYSNAVCGALDWGISTFFFEAFDEPWKPKSVGENGQAAVETTWGAMNADRSKKPGYNLMCSGTGGAS